jgi:hypothetical protein
MIDKSKFISILSITLILVSSQLVGCGKSMEDSEETIVSEESTTEENITEVETTTIEETTTEEETSTVEETTTEEETSTTANETQISSSTDVIVHGNFTFASDAAQSDIDQILKAHDEVSVSVSECDTNGDGLIDKDEAAEAASFYDDEMIGLIKDLGEALKNTDFSDIGSDSNSDSSSSSSNSTEGAGKVESWADTTNEDDFIDFSTPTDHSDLSRGVTVY